MESDPDFDGPAWHSFALDFCRRRCPDLAEQELAEAAERFLTYIKIGWRQHRRLKAEGRLDEIPTEIRALEAHRKRYFIGRLMILLLFRRDYGLRTVAHVVKPPNE